MKLSAPLHLLKSRAKALKKTEGITLTEALDQVAQSEGYVSWSLLSSKKQQALPRTRQEVLGYLKPCDLMLIGARPGLGKTQLAIEMAVQALKEGRRAYFFSLEYTLADIANHFSTLINDKALPNELSIDLSDDISASYIIEKTRETIQNNSFIVVDYLQLLDQKRSKPDLQMQIQTLKGYAKETGCIIVFISQLDRLFDDRGGVLPSLEDVRMPNEFDLGLINKLMLIHQSRLLFIKPAQFELS